MSEAINAPSLEHYRGYLVLLAKSLWGRRFQSRGDPSDLAQQALLEAHEQRDDFKGKSPGEFAGWLRVILAHTVADAVRKNKRGKRDPQLERSINAALDDSSSRLFCGLATDAFSSPSKNAIRAEELNHLAESLGLLPSDQQQAIVFHKLQQLSLAETAKEMGKTVPGVAGLLRRGLKGLREMMKSLE